MIDPDTPGRIRFCPADQPELPDILQMEIEAGRQDEERRKQETRRWLEDHTGFEPFGDVW